MFFGLEVKSAQNQAKPITLANTLKLSQAVLEPGKKDNGGKKEPVCLMAEYDKKQFILCVLDPNKSWQSPLDLVFEGGSQVKFFVRGQGTVHITGYENFDDLDDMSMSMSDDDEDLSDDDIEQVVSKKVKPIGGAAAEKRDSKIPNLQAQTKSPKVKATNGVKPVPNKKDAKAQNQEDDGKDNDSSESDDEDFDLDDLESDDDDDDMDDEDMSDEDIADEDESEEESEEE